MPDGWGSSGPEAFTPKTLVTVALAAVEAAGWVPRSAVDGKRQPTAGLVADYLLDNREPGRKARELLDPYMDAATKRVAAVIETLAEAFADSTNDYEANLVAALTALSVEHRQFGLVCSAPSAYQRILTRPPRPPNGPSRQSVNGSARSVTRWNSRGRSARRGWSTDTPTTPPRCSWSSMPVRRWPSSTLPRSGRGRTTSSPEPR